MFEDRRSRERLSVEPNAATKLVASIQCNGEEPKPVQIRDLSRWGIGFLITNEPKINVPVMLSLVYRGATIRFRATVKWANHLESGEWSAGCEFATELGEDFLTDLSSAKVLSPDAQREAAWVKALVRTNAAPDDIFPAEIVNYSVQGVCIATRDGLGPGENVLLEVDDGHRPRTLCAAVVVWERPEEGCVLQGCVFPEKADAKFFYQAVKRHVSREDQPEPSPVKLVEPQPRIPAGVLAGFAVAAGWCLLYFTRFWPGR